MLRSSSFGTAILLAELCWSIAPNSVRACSCVAQGFAGGEPADGAMDVPIDVQPWVHAPVLSAQDIVLQDAAGNPVDADVRVTTGGSGGYDCFVSFAEIVPREALKKNTRYEMRLVSSLAGGSSDSWSFTTGQTRQSRSTSVLLFHLGVLVALLRRRRDPIRVAQAPRNG